MRWERGAGREGLKGGEAGEDGTEPGEGGVGTKAGEVGPYEGEVGEVAGCGAWFVVGGFLGVTDGVEPGAGGGCVGEVGGQVRDGNGAIDGDGGWGLEGGSGHEIRAGLGGGGGGAIARADGGVWVAQEADGEGDQAEKGIVAGGGKV